MTEALDAPVHHFRAYLSFFFDFTNGLMNYGAIKLTSCPYARNIRAQ